MPDLERNDSLDVVARLPFHYPLQPLVTGQQILGSSSTNTVSSTDPVAPGQPCDTYFRYKYYLRLKHHEEDTLSIPRHVIPAYFLLPLSMPNEDEPPTQSSIVTIFAIWNTMMGTSLLTMPWAVSQAGLGASLILMLLMCLLCLYTTYRVIDSKRFAETLANSKDVEFLDIANQVLGGWGRWSAVLFSFIALLGATIVFWVLMSTFSQYLALFTYEATTGTSDSNSTATVVCTTIVSNATGYGKTSVEPSAVKKLIESNYLWPIALAVIILPLINIKDPTFFHKFTALGTVSVVYLLGYTIYNSISWGININFNDITSEFYASAFRVTFPALTGVMCLSFFIQNCILSMLKFQKNPENNMRDLSIAFFLVAMTYLLIGVPFYVTFPLPKSCIADNFLNNFPMSDTMATVTRAFLLLQYLTLYPLISYILRMQALSAVFGSPFPGRLHVVLFNFGIVITCVLFAIFVPQVGTILRYCGALSGLAYVFTLPTLVYLVGLHKRGSLTTINAFFHSIIILVGVVNFAAQFALPYLSPDKV